MNKVEIYTHKIWFIVLKTFVPFIMRTQAPESLQFASQAFYALLDRVIQSDRILRESISSYTFEDGQLSIKANPGKHLLVQKKLFRIVRQVWLSGVECRNIRINNRAFDWQFLTETAQPRITHSPDGSYDNQLKMTILEQKVAKGDALLEGQTLDATVFIINLEGVYLEVHMQRGIESKIPPQDMEGKPMLKVLPCRKTAEFILEKIRETYYLGEPQIIEYGLWDRRYRSKIVPIRGNKAVTVICFRIQ